MAVIGNQKSGSIQIGSLVSASSTASSGTLYTVPSGCYLVVLGASISGSGSGTCNVVMSIGSNGISNQSSLTASATYSQQTAGQLMVGPGQSITFTMTGITTLKNASFTGMLMQNT